MVGMISLLKPETVLRKCQAILQRAISQRQARTLDSVLLIDKSLWLRSTLRVRRDRR